MRVKHIVNLIEEKIQLVINTTSGDKSIADSFLLEEVLFKIKFLTLRPYPQQKLLSQV